VNQVPNYGYNQEISDPVVSYYQNVGTFESYIKSIAATNYGVIIIFPSIASTQFFKVLLTVVITPSILVTSYNKYTFNGTYNPLAVLPATFNEEGPPILSIVFLTSFILKSIGI